MKEKQFHADYYRPSENQGKRKKQYETSAKIIVWSVAVFTLTIIVLGIYEAFTNL